MVCYDCIEHFTTQSPRAPSKFGGLECANVCVSFCFPTDKNGGEKPLACEFACWVVRGKGREAKGLPLRHSSVRGDLTWCLWGTCSSLLTVGVSCEQAARGHVSSFFLLESSPAGNLPPTTNSPHRVSKMPTGCYSA